MRRVGLAALLLAASSSCATVDPVRPSKLSTAEPESNFRVVSADPPKSSKAAPSTPGRTEPAVPAPPMKAAKLAASTTASKSPSSPTTGITRASATDDPFGEVRTASLQTSAPTAPPPEPSPLPNPVRNSDSEAKSDSGRIGSAAEGQGTDSADGVASPGMALESPGDPAPAAVSEKGITIEEAVALALNCNPTIAEAAASVRQMEAEWAQSGFYPNPLVYYVGSNLFDGQDNAGQHGIYVQQPVVTANKLGWNRSVLSGDIGDARAQLEAQRLRVQVDARLRFYEALGADRLVQISTQIRDNAQRGLNATRDLFDAGQATRADVLQAEVTFNQASVTLRQAEINAEAARRQLIAVMGRPDLYDIELAGDFGEPPQLDDFETAWQRLRATSPDLRSAASRVARYRARIGREQAERISDIDTQLSLQHDFLTNYPVGYAQIGMAIPFHHRNQGAIASAQQQYVRASREYERRELALRSRLAVAYQQIESARTAVERYRSSILPAAAENLELTRAGYARGEFDLLRLLIAQRTFAETNIQFVTAQVQLQSANAQTQGLLLTGGLDEPPAPQGAGGFGTLIETPKAQ